MSQTLSNSASLGRELIQLTIKANSAVARDRQIVCDFAAKIHDGYERATVEEVGHVIAAAIRFKARLDLLEVLYRLATSAARRGLFGNPDTLNEEMRASLHSKGVQLEPTTARSSRHADTGGYMVQELSLEGEGLEGLSTDELFARMIAPNDVLSDALEIAK